MFETVSDPGVVGKSAIVCMVVADGCAILLGKLFEGFFGFDGFVTGGVPL